MDNLPKISPGKTGGTVSCGLYRTTKPYKDLVPAGRLVYYHNHGDPGPGLYPVERWNNNKAVFKEKGIPIHEERYATTLKPLKPEGFYRVTKEFHCCEKRCRRFKRDMLVQLGYNGEGAPIVFVPEWHDEGLLVPLKGNRVEDHTLHHLKPLKVVHRFGGAGGER